MIPLKRNMENGECQYLVPAAIMQSNTKHVLSHRMDAQHGHHHYTSHPLCSDLQHYYCCTMTSVEQLLSACMYSSSNIMTIQRTGTAVVHNVGRKQEKNTAYIHTYVMCMI